MKPFREVDLARVRYLRHDEILRLVNAAQGEFRTLVNAALFTGCRYGELTRLRVYDFNPDTGTVFVAQSKSGKARHVILSEEGQGFFAQITAGRSNNSVLLPKAGGEPWGYSHQLRPMRDACDRARIPDVSFHVPEAHVGFASRHGRCAHAGGRAKPWARRHADDRAPLCTLGAELRRRDDPQICAGVRHGRAVERGVCSAARVITMAPRAPASQAVELREEAAAPKASRVLGWFQEAAKPGDKLPSLKLCNDLARNLQIIRNRANNNKKIVLEQGKRCTEKEGRVLSLLGLGLADVESEEWWTRAQLKPFMDAAGRLLAEANKLGPDFHGYQFPSMHGEGEAISLDEIRRILLGIGAKTKTRGRPEPVWHRPGYAMAAKIQVVLKESGQTKRLAMAQPASITASVSAAAVNWAFGVKITPDRFAAAMKVRKPVPFEKRFPDATKVKLETV